MEAFLLHSKWPPNLILHNGPMFSLSDSGQQPREVGKFLFVNPKISDPPPVLQTGHFGTIGVYHEEHPNLTYKFKSTSPAPFLSKPNPCIFAPGKNGNMQSRPVGQPRAILAPFGYTTGNA